jgi:pyruvate/2-oxoglutarate/acetoin dehydrogenase E1 component
MPTVRTLDAPGVLNAIEKTGRLSVGQPFGCLTKAAVRVVSPDHPVLSSPFMATDYCPALQQIADAVIT